MTLIKVKKVVAGVLLTALMLGAVSGPALAINDALVPAEDCAPANAEAVGHPAASALVQTGQVSPPASRENPGVSTGAMGQELSQAPENCG
jgi:hypothetical protein